MTLTPACESLFKAYAADAPNWGGTPLVGGNVDSSLETNGNLMWLKRHGLIRTFKDDGLVWVEFTDKGHELARSLGLE